MGHRRFLHENHPFRFDANKFGGTTEFRPAPKPLSEEEILECTKDLSNSFGKDPSGKETNQEETKGRGALSNLQKEIYLVLTFILERFNVAS